MCGITGWINWRENVEQHEQIIRHMAKTLAKRGPDALNTWLSKHVAFGHTRLVVVDPAGGSQPMTRQRGDTQYTIIYNGELYNTEELRGELLQKGYTFQGHSDTEVLLRSFIEWGEDCVQKLNGIFAFAVWDEQNQSLFLARDRLGVKPLFYHMTGHSIIFGSEIKAILAHPDVQPLIDETGLAEIFGLGPSHTPGHGVIKGIHELRPAHTLRFNRKGHQVSRYWQVQSENHQGPLADTVDHLRHLLTDTIERQLVADVPVCTFLSGGIDSSAISSIAARKRQKEGQHTLQTYSIDYVDNDKYFTSNDYQPNADAPYIDKVTDYLGTVHHSLSIHTESLVDLLKEAVKVRDLPGMADIDSSLLWFCQQVKKQATVALSGECADEIFGGYPWFHRQDLVNRPGFPWMDSIQQRESLLLDQWKEKLQLKEYVHQRYQESLREVPLLDGEGAEERRRRELFYLNMTWFMPTLLERKDRMSMGASLEVRVPFADHRLVEYVWNIPWEMKMVDQREKGILRRALKGILPEEILYRKKSPYPKTYHPYYTKAVTSWLADIVSDLDSPLLQFVDRHQLKQLIETEGEAFDRPWFGQLMKGPQLIAHLCQIDLWLRAYQIRMG